MSDEFNDAADKTEQAEQIQCHVCLRAVDKQHKDCTTNGVQWGKLK